MTEYTYVFANLRTGAIIGEIPLFGTYCARRLNDSGEFQGAFQLDQTGQNNDDLLSMTIPGRCFVVMEREGTPVWGGPVWSRTYQSQAKVVQIYCRGFEVYPSRIFTGDYTITDDQLNIFTDIWNTIQSVPQRNIGISVPSTVFPDEVVRTVDVKSYDYRTFGQVINDMANGAFGFDWTIDIGRVDNVYVKSLRFAYPNLGTSIGPNSIVFEYPGAILNYYETASMADAGTNIFVLGQGEGSDMLASSFVHQDLIDNGWPEWHIDISQKDITDQDMLESITQQEAINRRPPMVVDKITIRGNADPIFGSYGLGDSALLVFTDPMHPNTTEVEVRIAEWILRPQISDESSEEVDIVFAGGDL